MIAVTGQFSPVNRLLFWHFCCRPCAVSHCLAHRPRRKAAAGKLLDPGVSSKDFTPW